MAVMSFLVGLPSEFETAKSQILSSSEIGSLQEVFSRILRTEGTYLSSRLIMFLLPKEEAMILGENQTTGEEARLLIAITMIQATLFATTVMGRAIPRNSARNYKIIIKDIRLLMFPPPLVLFQVILIRQSWSQPMSLQNSLSIKNH